ncbi:MAG: hypothetical protein RI964_1579 [Pseudomonadota bacterium]|jgi:cell wall-associated NlpC family hydrolase
MSCVSVKNVWSLGIAFTCSMLLFSGCSTAPTPQTTARVTPQQVATAQVSHPQKSVTLLEKVVWNAQKQQGKMYRWGGTSPVTGFDCSGLTQYAFQKGAGVSIPRTAAAQYASAVKIPAAQARKGDLVFFNTHGHKVSHVGVYLGQNKFLHAPRTGKAITTSKLDGYWQQNLVGFGRIPGACRPAFS